jgi:hypothetical protein
MEYYIVPLKGFQGHIIINEFHHVGIMMRIKSGKVAIVRKPFSPTSYFELSEKAKHGTEM